MSKVREVMLSIVEEKIEETIKEELVKLVKEEIFDKFEEINMIAVPAYAPYFNDGEVCEYRVHWWSPYINGINVDEVYDDVFEVYDDVLYKKYNTALNAFFNTSERLVRFICEDGQLVFERVPSGEILLKVESYEHE